MHRWKSFAALAVGLVAMGVAAAGNAQQRKDPREAWKPKFDPSRAKYVMRVSNVSTPALEGVMVGFRIRDSLWERTGGQLYFDYYPLSMLGGEVEVLNQLAMGAVQGMLCSSVVAPRIGPRFGIVNLPFLIDTPEKLDKFIADKEVFEHFLRAGEGNGVVALDVASYGIYGWAARRPVRKLADAKSMKFRVAEADVNQSLYRAWGLATVPLPWPEVQTALKQGVIDVLDHTATIHGLTKKFEVAGSFVEVNYAQGLFIHLVNKRWFDSLPADLQKALVDVVREESAKARANAVVQEQTEIQKAKKAGIDFVKLPAEDMALLKRQGEAVFKEWEGRIGADYLNRVKALLDGPGAVAVSPPPFVSPSLPPNLTASVVLEEPSGNRALDALEEGAFVVRLENTGKGDARDVGVKVSWEGSPKGLTLTPRTSAGTVAAGRAVEVKIPVRAEQGVPDQTVTALFEFPEAGGFDADPVAVRFETRAYQAPRLVLADLGIDDQSGNGQVEPQEIVEVTARVQNLGPGEAARVTARVVRGENVFLAEGSRAERDLGNLAAGEYRDVKFSFYTNKRIAGGETIPLALELAEGRGRFDGKEPLQIVMNAPQRRAQEVVVQGAARAPAAAVELAGGLSVDVNQNIPEGKTRRPDAVAVIIGNRTYRSAHVPPVEFADRDAAFVREHLLKTLGYDAKNVIHLTDATLSDFNRVFGTRRQTQGQLANFVRAGKSEVFVYYSGHGAPDPDTQGAYFVPSDADPDYIATGGYPLDLFWENLAKIPAAGLTVVLDTCFSGNVDGGQFLLKDVSPALLQVKAELRGPEGSTVMTSAAADQVSNWYREKRHGLFTYWWLKGIRGEADMDGDGAVTVGELGAFLREQVAYHARRFSGREQTPVVQGVESAVVVRLR